MVGWVHSGVKQTGDDGMFNIILRDGTRSNNDFTWDGEVFERYDYRLPQNNRITAVTIYYFGGTIRGFSFHLSDGSDWDIGRVAARSVTVEIAENEVIVGFKSKSHPDCPAIYTEN